MSQKVVITGMGTINPIGDSVEESWSSALEGVSGVSAINAFDPSKLKVSIAAEVGDFPIENVLSTKEIRRMDRFEHFAFYAAAEAMDQSGLVISPQNEDRVGVFVSSSTGGISTLEKGVEAMLTQRGKGISPFMATKFITSGAAGLLSIKYGAKGPAMSIASACASGADGIGMAWQLIRAGVVDAAIAGASEATVSQMGIASLDRAGAMSRRKDGSLPAPQPFDRDRDGFVMGEGAGILILESEDSARERGAEILAELVGYGASADAFHITAPSEKGEGAAQAMNAALNSAQLNASDIHYINAHGTATILGDVAETRAIKRVFTDYASHLPVSSTKSMTGHMLGATGALEAIFSVLAIADNAIPPTINLENPDEECDLDYVPKQARDQHVKYSMSNSFGFGGHNAVLIFQQHN